MELKLQSSESTYDKQTNDMASQTYNDPENDSPEDDFSDLEEDTLFIADRYKNNTVQPVPQTDNPAVIKKGIPDWVTFIPFTLSVILSVLGYILAGHAMGSGVAATELFQTPGFALISFGQILIVVDAVIMAIQGNGFGLILWAVFLTPIYYFKRCRARDESTLLAWIALMAIVLSVGYYTKQTMNLYSNLTNGGSTVGSMAGTPASATDTQKMVEAFSRVYYLSGDQEVFMDRLIKDNISDPQYQGYLNSDGALGQVVVSGTTTLRGKSQKIEMHVSGTDYSITSIVLGWKTYNRGTNELTELVNELIANTTPGVH